MNPMPNLEIARIYDHLDEAPDGDTLRVLVDRLWPRGVSKERAQIDVWAKDVTPSDALRTAWHRDPDGHSPAHYAAFTEAYAVELHEEPARSALIELAAEVSKSKRTLLLTATHDPEHSHVPVLLAALARGAD